MHPSARAAKPENSIGNQQSMEDPSASLLAAAEGGDAETVASLLASRAAVDACSSTGVTALMKAAHAGHVSAVRCLLSAGADAAHHDNLHCVFCTVPLPALHRLHRHA